MVFYDLNIPYTAGQSSAGPNDNLKRTVELLAHFGYEVIAFNNVITGKLLPNHVNPIQILPNIPRLRQLTRVTLILEDTNQNFGLNLSSPSTNAYDLLAIHPTTEKTFKACCTDYDIDIISIDCSTRLPFYLKHSTVGAAIERGICFEITYSRGIRDAGSRRHLISNAQALVRASRGKSIIFSSEALLAMELRGPYDLINLGTLFNMSQPTAKDCISKNPRAVIYHAESRRGTHKSVISVAPISNLKENEEWKAGVKRKLESDENSGLAMRNFGGNEESLGYDSDEYENEDMNQSD